MPLVWTRCRTTSATDQPSHRVGRAQPAPSSGSSKLDSSACCSMSALTIESTASLPARDQTGHSMSLRSRWLPAVMLVVLIAAACSGGGDSAQSSSSSSSDQYPNDDRLRLNDLQVLGSHN